MWGEILISVIIIFGFIGIGILLRIGGLIMEWLWKSDD